MRNILFVLLVCIFAANAQAQIRSFTDIFPNLAQETRTRIFSETGYVRTSQRSGGFVILGNTNGCAMDPQITDIVMRNDPGYIVESISVIPGAPGSVRLLDIYNALGNIRDLKGRLYDSETRGRPVPLFEEANRIVSDRNTNSISDPPPSAVLPNTETVYIRLKDANFGNTYYRGDMVIMQNGLRYTLTNFRNMTYLLIPVIREGRLIAQLYFEPIREGVLLYSIMGADMSDFFANRIHVPSAISKRLAVINEWAADGIRRNSR